MDAYHGYPQYLELTELQPANPYHHQQQQQQPCGPTQSNCGGPSTSYDIRTAGNDNGGGDEGDRGGGGDSGGRGSVAGSTGAGSGAIGVRQAGCTASSHTAPMHHQHESRKSRLISYAENYDSMSDTSVATSSTTAMAAPSNRKRKNSVFGLSNFGDDDSEDNRSTRTASDSKRQNHSEIEKRRRDKMNTYISELSSMVPMCGAMARKLDKLTVLRMAVQHMRTVRGSLSSCPLSARPRPACVSDQELNRLVLSAAQDVFVLVVGCDRGKLLYLSNSVTNMLNYLPSELLGQSLFDILHPKDVAKVKEQLSSSDISPRERLIDAKTMLPLKAEMGAGASRLCPGARRSFFCRIKCKLVQTPPDQPSTVKEERGPTPKIRRKNEKKYCVVQFTGYLKSWAPAELCENGMSGAYGGGTYGAEGEGDEPFAVPCLVAVGRALASLVPQAPPPPQGLPDAPVDHSVPHPPPPPTRSLQYISRHTIDGKYLFVDQRVTLAMGFLPQELLGTSLYEHVGGGGGVGGCSAVVGGGELGGVAVSHKQSLMRRQPQHTPAYNARCKDGTYATMQTQFKPFKNPWTKEFECLIAQNTLVCEAEPAADPAFTDLLRQQKTDEEVQRLIDSQVESLKIGSAIAEEALRSSSADVSPDLPLPADLLQDVVFNQAMVENILVNEAPYRVRNNVSLSAAGAASPSAPEGTGEGSQAEEDEREVGLLGSKLDSPLSVSPPMTMDGNGEAAMAVIMSLLEADAGLGGPINFATLPWPLP